MFNRDKVIEALAKQVGFEPDESGVHLIAESLQSKLAGMSYNQGHPLVDYDNILATIEEKPIAGYPAFSADKAYKKLSVVAVEGVLYQAIVDVPAGAFSPAAWEETNQLSLILKKIESAAAAEVVTNLMANKQISDKGKAIWENLKIYEGLGSLINTIPSEGRFVGLEIDLSNMKDMAFRLHSIGIQLSQPNPTLDIYIYHTSKRTPIHKVTLNDVGAGAFSWHPLDILLPFAGEYAPGGSFIIGYKESQLVGNAIRKTDYTFGKRPCSTCSDYNVKSYDQWSKQVAINPFSVSEANILGDSLWDRTYNRYNYSTNFGINLSMGIECDITDTVVNNAHVFAEAHKTAVVVKILERLVYNTVNSTRAEKMRQMADYELNNRENHTDGLIKKRDKIMQALNFNFSDLNSMCFPQAAQLLSKGAI